MATIVLQEDEVFEHFHSGPSRTILEDGQVQLIMNGETSDLRKGEVVHIPPNTSHALKNVGPSSATVSCLH